MATTTNFGWSTPDNTSYVKDGASSIRTLGSSIDTTVNAFNRGKVLAVINTNTTSLTGGVEATICTGSATIVPNRRYTAYANCAFQAGASGSGNAMLWLNTGSFNRGIAYETTSVAANLNTHRNGTITFSAADVGVTTGSGTATTFNLKLRTSNNCTLQTNPDSILGSNTYPQILFIEDAGPA